MPEPSFRRDLVLNSRGDDVRTLQSDLELLGATLPDAEKTQSLFGPATRDAVAKFQAASGLQSTGAVDAATGEAIRHAVAVSAYVVRGRVVSPDRAGVGGLRVRVIDRNVGADVEVATATTGKRGAYVARFGPQDLARRRKAKPDLQAEVYAGQTLLGKSAVRYNAPHALILDVRLPAGLAALPSEHETLTRDLGAHYDGHLADLQETAQRPDVTYLANKSGWDARAVALAARADQLATTRPPPTDTSAPTPAIPAPLYYALLRAGLPSDPAALFRTSPATVARLWKKAVDGGLVPHALAAQLPAARQAFEQRAATNILGAAVRGRISTVREMLRLSLGDDAQRHHQFAETYAKYRNDVPAFWTHVTQMFGEATTRRLRLDADLGHLTADNAPLLQRLYAAEPARPLAEPVDLARRGYHRADKWVPLLDDNVPPQIKGASPAERRQRYADVLAAQVRARFPTAVAAEQVRSGEIPLTTDPALRDGVAAFLATHQHAFDLGRHRLDGYLAKHALFEQVTPEVRDGVKRLQRVYQMTPNDHALTVLLQRNVTSASQAARYSQSAFVRSFSADLGGDAAARLVHARATQIHRTVVNVATSFMAARSSTRMGASDDHAVIDSWPWRNAPAQPDPGKPTLEQIFGEMDFCSCEQCASILSPTAYLVDLLQFLDVPDPEIDNPYTVLVEKRPDLIQLPLSCENTNTVLPYIDVVNETLEYFVSHGLSLASYTGHDTGDTVTSDDLLATPQNVDAGAYDTLAAALFPLPLPFDRPLEGLRRTFALFEVPLAKAMETLRVDDAVDRVPPATDYGWRVILMEQLGLSTAEHALLTTSTAGLAQLYGYDGWTDDAARADLANAKTFARRLNVTYEDVVALIETRFVNPDSVLIPRLERLGVSFGTLQAIHDQTLDPVADAQLDALWVGLDLRAYAGDIRAWIRDDAVYDRIKRLIILVNTTGGDDLCNFEELGFRYADPAQSTTPRAIDFVRLLRFVRLWKKLGWSIAETDMTLAALFPPPPDAPPAGDAVELAALDAAFLIFLPRLGTVSRLLPRLGLRRAKELPSLLACFGLLDTAGDDSLYRRKFQNPTVATLDDAFADDGYGNVPAGGEETPPQTLDALRDPLRAAFNLTDEELDLLAGAMGLDLVTAALSLENLSALYRRAWLARKLRMSATELVLISAFSGLDPFALPDPPLPPVEQFLDLRDALAGGALSATQALYLVWNEDVSGKSVPTESEITELARVLRSDFAQTTADFALTEDPTGEIAHARFSLAYGSDVADEYWGLLGNTIVTSIDYDQDVSPLDDALVAASAGRLAYDVFRKKLSWAGVLDVPTRDLLVGLAATNALQTGLGALYDAGQAAIAPFFARFFELRAAYDAYVASSAPPADRWNALLADLLPALEARRKRQQALSAVSAASGADPLLAQLLLDDAAALHAGADPARPALDDVLALDEEGALGAAGFGGFIEPPASGDYFLAVIAGASATVQLFVDGAEVLLTEDAAAPGTFSSQGGVALSLAAATLHPVELTVSGAAATPVLRWWASGGGWETVPGRYLYGAAAVEGMRAAYVRLLKTSTLATALGLTPAETAHLATDAGGAGWLNTLPVSGSADTATAVALRDQLLRVLDFARLKKAYAPDDERLLDVLVDPGATLENGEDLLLTLTGWDGTSLEQILGRFGFLRTHLSTVENLARVNDAIALVEKTGIAANALVAASTNRPVSATVTAAQAALRARYDDDSWREIVKPLNDQMRALQRDALVAYILRRFAADPDPLRQAVDTADKLFEYFLMDVQMEPCMQTSRIRHALSSVQLFVERCLLRLEDRVAPSSIDADQWKWMKRYRVWEANRKVFLWPENWLEPELRDDQSPLFKEVMGQLLESDITEDTAADALLAYLGKLEEVAKLVPCGVHYVEPDAEGMGEVVHVVARSHGASRKYYYRRKDAGSWLPWEPVKVDIEDDPIIPVVWRDRLFLFWVRIIKSTAKPTGDASNETQTTEGTELRSATVGAVKAAAADDVGRMEQTVSSVLCFSENSGGKWLPPRTSDPEQALELGSFPASGDGAFFRSDLRLRVQEEVLDDDPLLATDPKLFVELSNGSQSVTFRVYNTHCTPTEDSGGLDLTTSPSRLITCEATNVLSIDYDEGSGGQTYLHQVLNDAVTDSFVEPRHDLASPWTAPFLYHDHRHVFWVTTSVIAEPTGYGPPQVETPVKEIPGLALQEAFPEPNPEGPVSFDGSIAVVNPSPIERFVSHDRNIDTAISAGGTVQFGDATIGPGGAIAKTTTTTVEE